MKKFIFYSPLKTLIILASLIYLGKAVIFFAENPNFLLIWDWPGHLERASIATFPWQGGWDTAFWAGYPTATYPNFYHLLLKAAIILAGGNEKAGAIGLTFAILFLQLHALFILTKRIIKTEIGQTAAFLLTLALMSHGSGSLMGSFRGTLFTGGGPGALASAQLLYFLSTKHFRERSLWLGLMFLTHPLSALIGLIELLIKLLSNFKTQFLNSGGAGGVPVEPPQRSEEVGWGAAKRQDPSHIKHQLITLLIGTLIGLPWILPMLDPSFATVAFNLGGNPTQLPWIFISILLLIIVESSAARGPLILTALIVGLLTVTPNWIMKLIEQLGIRGIHFYRFGWYVLLLSPTAIISGIRSNFDNLILKQLNKNTKLSLATLSLLAIAVGNQPKLNVELKTDFSKVTDLSGRVMDTAGHTSGLGIPQAMEHLLIKNTNLVGSTRWLFESGSKGLQFYDLKSTVNPSSFRDGTNIDTYVDLVGNNRRSVDIEKAAKLLGVSYLSYTTRQLPQNIDNQKLFHIGTITVRNGQTLIPLYYVLEKVSGATLIDTLEVLPEVNPDVDLGEWWAKGEWNSLVASEPPPIPTTEINLSRPEVKNLAIDASIISFLVESEAPAPVSVRFTYSPYWTARSVSNSYVSQPIWVSPGNMLVYGSGKIELVWKTPSYLARFSPISAITLMVLVTLSIAGRRHYMSHLKPRKTRRNFPPPR